MKLELIIAKTQPGKNKYFRSLFERVNEGTSVGVMVKHQSLRERNFVDYASPQVKKTLKVDGIRHSFFGWNLDEENLKPQIMVFYNIAGVIGEDPKEYEEFEEVHVVVAKGDVETPDHFRVSEYDDTTTPYDERTKSYKKLLKNSKSWWEAGQKNKNIFNLAQKHSIQVDLPVITLGELRKATEGCESRQEFRKKNPRLYSFLQYKESLDLLNTIVKKHRRRTKWTIESAQKLAKSYNVKYEFREAHHGAYKFLVLNNALPPFKRGKSRWTLEKAQELFKKVGNRRKFQREYAGAYEFLLRNDPTFRVKPSL